MGNANSGRFDRDDRNKPRSAIAVAGSGLPERPKRMSPAVAEMWDWLVEQTSGLAFAQDSLALLELARLWVDQEKVHESLEGFKPTDKEWQDLNKQRLANGRQLILWFGKFGLDSRDRQSLLKPETAEKTVDEAEEMLSEMDEA